jgi:hypothetical protein
MHTLLVAMALGHLLPPELDQMILSMLRVPDQVSIGQTNVAAGNTTKYYMFTALHVAIQKLKLPESKRALYYMFKHIERTDDSILGLHLDGSRASEQHLVKLLFDTLEADEKFMRVVEEPGTGEEDVDGKSYEGLEEQHYLDKKFPGRMRIHHGVETDPEDPVADIAPLRGEAAAPSFTWYTLHTRADGVAVHMDHSAFMLNANPRTLPNVARIPNIVFLAAYREFLARRGSAASFTMSHCDSTTLPVAILLLRSSVLRKIPAEDGGGAGAIARMRFLHIRYCPNLSQNLKLFSGDGFRDMALMRVVFSLDGGGDGNYITFMARNPVEFATVDAQTEAAKYEGLFTLWHHVHVRRLVLVASVASVEAARLAGARTPVDDVIELGGAGVTR